MARKKNKQAQKDKKALKDKQAQAVAGATTTPPGQVAKDE
jgi:hypothetical protein